MRIKLVLTAVLLLAASLAAHATTATYDFTYTSTSGNLPGETANGTGSFDVSYPFGTRGGTITAFSFTNTIDSSIGDSTFVYHFNDLNVAASNIVLTLGGEDIARGTITAATQGTDTSFGTVQFVLNIGTNGVVTGSTSYLGNGNANSAADATTGVGTVTFVGTDVTPEPSSFVLLGSGLLGLVGVVKRRLV
ncbi:MAG TPA: PEP-CTERM sorting domain-containing protein [Edaphobacter sp.]|nr:PEP-CTERM sorting domain-containing protein [Edaphobacter sp.]